MSPRCNSLQTAGLTYACDCSRKTLGQLTSYPGYCRNKSNISTEQPYNLRLKLNDRKIQFEDALQGPQSYSQQALGDPVLWRKINQPSYHFANAVDDAALGITHSLRGIDLLDMAPMQIAINNALGKASPTFIHLPMLVNEAGRKLSKQTFAPSISQANPCETLSYLFTLLGLAAPPTAAQTSPKDLVAWALDQYDGHLSRGAQKHLDGNASDQTKITITDRLNSRLGFD